MPRQGAHRASSDPLSPQHRALRDPLSPQPVSGQSDLGDDPTQDELLKRSLELRKRLQKTFPKSSVAAAEAEEPNLDELHKKSEDLRRRLQQSALYKPGSSVSLAPAAETRPRLVPARSVGLGYGYSGATRATSDGDDDEDDDGDDEDDEDVARPAVVLRPAKSGVKRASAAVALTANASATSSSSSSRATLKKAQPLTLSQLSAMAKAKGSRKRSRTDSADGSEADSIHLFAEPVEVPNGAFGDDASCPSEEDVARMDKSSAEEEEDEDVGEGSDSGSEDRQTAPAALLKSAAAATPAAVSAVPTATKATTGVAGSTHLGKLRVINGTPAAPHEAVAHEAEGVLEEAGASPEETLLAESSPPEDSEMMDVGGSGYGSDDVPDLELAEDDFDESHLATLSAAIDRIPDGQSEEQGQPQPAEEDELEDFGDSDDEEAGADGHVAQTAEAGSNPASSPAETGASRAAEESATAEDGAASASTGPATAVAAATVVVNRTDVCAASSLPPAAPASASATESAPAAVVEGANSVVSAASTAKPADPTKAATAASANVVAGQGSAAGSAAETSLAKAGTARLASLALSSARPAKRQKGADGGLMKGWQSLLERTRRHPQYNAEYIKRFQTEGKLWRRPKQETKARLVLGLDCEMVYAKGDPHALARVSVMSVGGSLLDVFIKREEADVLDFRTPISGVEPKHLTTECGAVSFDEAQDRVLALVSPDTILVGHGLQNDLRALRICHLKIVDTALLFTVEGKSQWRKHKLQSLVSMMKSKVATLRSVNTNAAHDSEKDAEWALQLGLYEASIHPRKTASLPLESFPTKVFINEVPKGANPVELKTLFKTGVVSELSYQLQESPHEWQGHATVAFESQAERDAVVKGLPRFVGVQVGPLRDWAGRKDVKRMEAELVKHFSRFGRVRGCRVFRPAVKDQNVDGPTFPVAQLDCHPSTARALLTTSEALYFGTHRSQFKLQLTKDDPSRQKRCVVPVGNGKGSFIAKIQ